MDPKVLLDPPEPLAVLLVLREPKVRQVLLVLVLRVRLVLGEQQVHLVYKDLLVELLVLLV